MRLWKAGWAPILLALAVLLAIGPVLAQEDGEKPACTAEDLAPIQQIVLAMIEAVNRGEGLSVDNLLRWRRELAALELTDCAEMRDLLLQLQLSSDELLIGTLLLERAATVPGAEASAEMAAPALNTGLVNLMGMRLLAGAVEPAPASGEIGSLTGADVLAAFDAVDVPYADANPSPGPAGGNAPDTQAERITFSLPSIIDGGMGQILIFADAQARDRWVAYLFGELDQPGYVYLHRNVILQLSPALDRSTALRFRAALRSLD